MGIINYKYVIMLVEKTTTDLYWFVILSGCDKQLVTVFTDTPGRDLNKWLLRDVGTECAIELLHCLGVKIIRLLDQLN